MAEDENLVYEIASGKIESVKINFYRDYARGINFGCALGRALKYSGYNFLMGIDLNAELSKDKLGYGHTYIRKSTVNG